MAFSLLYETIIVKSYFSMKQHNDEKHIDNSTVVHDIQAFSTFF
jgi:hypothetical protein